MGRKPTVAEQVPETQQKELAQVHAQTAVPCSWHEAAQGPANLATPPIAAKSFENFPPPLVAAKAKTQD